MKHRNARQSQPSDRATSAATRWLILMLLTVVGTLAPAGPVMAQDQGYASYWQLTFDFADSFNGTLHIDIGYDDGAGAVEQPALVSQDFPVACRRVGNVGLAGGAAIFAGGYLQCELDVKRTIAGAVQACQEVDPHCAISVDDQHSYPHLHMAAEVYSTTTGVAPLFFHRDARYTAIVSGTGTGSTVLKTTLTNMGTIQSTLVAPPPVLNNWLSYHADYDCNGCTMNFEIAGVTENVPVGPDMQVSFYTPASTIYIGYNPDNGYIIPNNTAIGFLSIDPPNMGSGG